MKIRLDDVVKANQELMFEAESMIGRPFLGPNRIGHAAQVMIRAAALYNDICLALVATKGEQHGKSGDQADEWKIRGTDDENTGGTV